MPDEIQQLRRSWMANANAWTDTVRNDRIESRRVITNAAIVEAVLESEGRQVLDLGCGEGWLARALTDRGCPVTGTDASAALIERARERGGGVFLELDYEQIACGALNGSRFDTIVANFSLLDDRIGFASLQPRGTRCASHRRTRHHHAQIPNRCIPRPASQHRSSSLPVLHRREAMGDVGIGP